jgi:hypothetical protein
MDVAETFATPRPRMGRRGSVMGAAVTSMLLALGSSWWVAQLIYTTINWILAIGHIGLHKLKQLKVLI